MSEASLFDALPYAAANVHSHDPDSSAIAAASIEASGSRKRHAAVVLNLVHRFAGRTACELWELATDAERAELKEQQEVRRRLTDLAALGLVTRGGQRRCAVRGSTMCEWWPTTGR